MPERLLDERLQRATETPSLLRIVLECRADEERPDDTEDDPPRGDPEASPAFGPLPNLLAHLSELEVLDKTGLVSLIELMQTYADHGGANTDDQSLAQRPR